MHFEHLYTILLGKLTSHIVQLLKKQLQKHSMKITQGLTAYTASDGPQILHFSIMSWAVFPWITKILYNIHLTDLPDPFVHANSMPYLILFFARLMLLGSGPKKVIRPLESLISHLILYYNLDHQSRTWKRFCCGLSPENMLERGQHVWNSTDLYWHWWLLD